MTTYIIRRIFSTIPVMGVVALIVFFLLRLGPGDPAAIMAGDDATPENVEFIRAQLGLNKPWYEQLIIWVVKLVQGDFGESIYTRKPVSFLMGQRLEPTIALTLSTISFAVLLAVPMGVMAAWKAGSLLDRVVMGFAVLGFSIPGFWLGFLFIYGFSIKLRWLPVQGYVHISQGFWPFVSHLILPTVTLGLVYMALIARITRTTVMEVMTEDYIRTANAKGVAPLHVLFGHALKNASVPIVTIIGVGIALLISGVVVVETVFALPGLGRLTVDAILQRDYPVIQAIIMVFSGVYVLINMLIDISYTLLDPRIAY